MATSRNSSGVIDGASGLKPPIVSDPTVVIFDESTRSDLYERWLSDLVTVETPRSCSESRSAIDEATALAVVRHELSEEKRTFIESTLAERAPYCRTLVVTSERDPVLLTTPSPDESLAEPIDETTFCDTVKREIRISVYAAALAKYYDCSARLTAARLNSESTVPATLEAMIDALAEVLSGIGPKLDSESVHEIRGMLRPDDGFDGVDDGPGRPSKYRPERCSNCDQAFRLGSFNRMGAYVWECTRCGTVHDRSDAANKRVAKRRWD